MSEPTQMNHRPSDSRSGYQEFRRSYRWLLLYGPWGLAVIGAALVGIGLFADRPGEVALSAIGFGAAMLIAGVLLPRMHGQLEVGPSGVKGAVSGIPEALMLAAATAKQVAEETIPADEPNKEQKVNEAIGRTISPQLPQLAERVEALIAQEHAKWVQLQRWPPPEAVVPTMLGRPKNCRAVFNGLPTRPGSPRASLTLRPSWSRRRQAPDRGSCRRATHVP
jgi:hypothetical protein